MNKKILGLLALGLLILNPLSAQAVEVDEEIEVSTCLEIKVSLTYRSNDVRTDGAVSELQDFLIANGYLDAQVSGFLGIKTVAAIKKFQADHGIKATGAVGPITRAKIKAISCDPAYSEAVSKEALVKAAINAELQALRAKISAEAASGASLQAQPALGVELEALRLKLKEAERPTLFPMHHDYYCNGELQAKPCEEPVTATPAEPVQETAVMVTSPNGGEVWMAGNSYTVTWKVRWGGSDNVKIYFDSYPYGKDMCLVGTAPASAGSFTFTLSQNHYCQTDCAPNMLCAAVVKQLKDGGYFVFVTPENNAKGYDYSDRAITLKGISSPTASILQIINPNLGEKWTVGSNFVIEWKSQNATGNVSLYFTPATNKKNLCFIGRTSVSAGRFPLTLKSDYRCIGGPVVVESGGSGSASSGDNARYVHGGEYYVYAMLEDGSGADYSDRPVNLIGGFAIPN